MKNWDLSTLFKDENNCEIFAQNLKNDCENFAKNTKLSSLNAEEFLQTLKTYEILNEKIAKIETFIELKYSLDLTIGAFYAKFSEICNQIRENLLFFEIEFNELDDKKAMEFINVSENFSYFLSNLRETKKHKLSLKEEKILLKTSVNGALAFGRLFDESFANFDFKMGKEILKEEEILAKFGDPNREIRKKSAKEFSKILKKNSHLLCFIYNQIKSNLKTKKEIRNYEFSEDLMHEYNQISKSSVDSLIEATENSFEISQKYYAKKREILGFDKLFDYDRYAPILQDEKKYSFEEANDLVLKAFYEFDKDFGDIAKMAFENGWIDSHPKQNKRSGAFAHPSVKSSHPFVLLNYTQNRRDVFTIAHELGHAIHQYLSYKVGFLNSQTPLTTSETASVFCEMLMFDYFLKISDENEKKSIIAGKLEDIFATLYRQINFTTFERRFHALQGEVSLEKINEIWLEESQKMFGDSLKLKKYYKFWWSYIPHFIHSPFYCYSYAFAQLLTIALFGLYKSGFANFNQIYKEFLSLGGSQKPELMVKKFGFDITKKEFWDIGLREIQKILDQFMELK